MYKIPVEILRYQANPKATKQAGDYYAIRATMWDAVFNAVNDYLGSRSQIGTYTRPLATAISQAYIETADLAYVEGGGSLPMDEDTAALAKSLLNEQLAFVDSLFERLKQLRKEGGFDAIREAFDRASGYTHSLDAFYNTIKIAGAGNKMLVFGGSDGKESCSDCKRLKGQRHRASWWKAHEFVPPSHKFECGGWNCEHKLFDDNGEVFTI